MKIRYMPTMIALLLLAALAVPAAMAATEDDPATLYFNQAQVAISGGQYDRAIELFDKALAENTTLMSQGDALMYLYKDKTAALTDLSRYDEAIATANAGIALYPNSTGLWNNKGYAQFKAGRNNEAVDSYNRAIALEPDYVKGWINKGFALSAAGRYDEAVTAFNKAISLDPENSDATTGLVKAKEGAAKAIPVTTIILVVIVIAAAGIAVWYVKFRKPEPAAKEQPENKGQKKKDKNKK